MAFCGAQKTDENGRYDAYCIRHGDHIEHTYMDGNWWDETCKLLRTEEKLAEEEKDLVIEGESVDYWRGYAAGLVISRPLPQYVPAPHPVSPYYPGMIWC